MTCILYHVFRFPNNYEILDVNSGMYNIKYNTLPCFFFNAAYDWYTYQSSYQWTSIVLCNNSYCHKAGMKYFLLVAFFPSHSEVNLIFLLQSKIYCCESNFHKKANLGLSWWLRDKNPSTKSGDMGSIPDLERSHTPSATKPVCLKF